MESLRKAQSMSLNVIIIALLCIVVLIVLIIIFTGRTRVLSSTTSDCAARGGECLDRCDSSIHVEHFGTSCASQDPAKPKCCARMV